jgi:hypothetical protein
MRHAGIECHPPRFPVCRGHPFGIGTKVRDRGCLRRDRRRPSVATSPRAIPGAHASPRTHPRSRTLSYIGEMGVRLRINVQRSIPRTILLRADSDEAFSVSQVRMQLDGDCPLTESSALSRNEDGGTRHPLSPMPEGPGPVVLCGDVEGHGWPERQHRDVRFLPAKHYRFRTHLVSASGCLHDPPTCRQVSIPRLLPLGNFPPTVVRRSGNPAALLDACMPYRKTSSRRNFVGPQQ